MSPNYTHIFTAALALTIILPGCNDAQSPDGSTTDRASLTYTSPPEGSLRLGAIHSFDGFDQNHPGELRLTSGETTVVVDQLVVIVSAIELHACRPGEHPDAQSNPPAERINFRPFDLIGGTAHAHTLGSSTRLGTPIARNLATEGGRARIVGETAPPLGIYCKIVPVFAPADDDLVNPTALSVEQLRGHTLLANGKWRATPEDDWQAFELTSDATHVVPLEAIDPDTGAPPIRFDSRSDVTLALIEPTLRPKLFNDMVDAFPNPSTHTGDRLLTRILDSLRIHEFNDQ